MPLMPTRIGQRLRSPTANRPRADIIKSRSGSHAVQRGKRQADENTQAPMQAGVEFVQKRRTFGRAAIELGGSGSGQAR